MDSGDESIRVQLARMEGKQDVTNERLTNVQTDIADLRTTQGKHGDRLGILEADRNIRSGQHQGLAFTGRILWAAIGTIFGGGGIAALLKLFGV